MVKFQLNDRVALITGSTRGIGWEVAKGMAEAGASVYVNGRVKKILDRRCQELCDLGYDAKPALFDATDSEAAESFLSSVANPVDILVNNAGIMREGNAEETSESDWFEQININLNIPFLLIKYALPLLKMQNGSIINVGSIEGLGSNPRHPAYCASKGGLHALTRAVAVDHGPEGVRCNAVAPGWINTELNEDFIKSLSDPKVFKNKIGEIHPLKRSGEPLEVSELIVWLASEKASFMTGQVLTIDGGRTAKLSLP